MQLPAPTPVQQPARVRSVSRCSVAQQKPESDDETQSVLMQRQKDILLPGSSAAAAQTPSAAIKQHASSASSQPRQQRAPCPAAAPPARRAAGAKARRHACGTLTACRAAYSKASGVARKSAPMETRRFMSSLNAVRRCNVASSIRCEPTEAAHKPAGSSEIKYNVMSREDAELSPRCHIAAMPAAVRTPLRGTICLARKKARAGCTAVIISTPPLTPMSPTPAEGGVARRYVRREGRQRRTYGGIADRREAERSSRRWQGATPARTVQQERQAGMFSASGLGAGGGRMSKPMAGRGRR